MADASTGWAIQHIEWDKYQITSLLDYDATDVELSGPNVQFVEMDFGGSNWHPKFDTLEPHAPVSVTLIPKLKGQPSKFRVEISWTDTSGETQREWYTIPQPGGYAGPVSTPNPKPTPNPKEVFVVHGRNKALRKDMFAFLRAIKLEPVEWSEAVQATGDPNPYVGKVLDVGFAKAQATLVLLTPDEMARLLPEYANEHDEPDLTEAAQPRPNVLFEAGMALGLHPTRTVLVEIGGMRQFSDIGGKHILRFKGTAANRFELVKRLRTAGCDANTDGEDWLEIGDFTPPKAPGPPGPPTP
jgi:hypothetical protein